MVQAEPSVEKLLKALLGRTFIASDLTTATAQIQNGHAGCDFVTLTGDLLSRHGIYTGGYLNGNGNPKGPASILGRKNQISELHGELTEVQLRVAEMSRKRGALLSEQTELQAGLQQAQTELREQEVAIATREGEFNAPMSGGHRDARSRTWSQVPTGRREETHAGSNGPTPASLSRREKKRAPPRPATRPPTSRGYRSARTCRSSA